MGNGRRLVKIALYTVGVSVVGMIGLVAPSLFSATNW
jgi:hypothetical protein